MLRFPHALMAMATLVSACTSNSPMLATQQEPKAPSNALQASVVVDPKSYVSGPLPNASPAVEALPEPIKENLSISKEQAERAARNYMGDSSIASIRVELKTVAELHGAEGAYARRVLTPDSPIWWVSMSGDLKGGSRVYQNAGNLVRTRVAGTHATLLVSAADGDVLVRSLNEPEYTELQVSH